jgi:hypothetical protein
MTKGVETKLTMEIWPNKAEITSDDIYEMIFYRNRQSKSGNKDSKRYGMIAKELVAIAAKKPDYLHDSRYEELSKHYAVTVNEYNFILKRLKLIGMVRKKGHVFVTIRGFGRYLRRLSLTMQNYCDDLGIPLEGDNQS